jgi:hypothetical protein
MITQPMGKGRVEKYQRLRDLAKRIVDGGPSIVDDDTRAALQSAAMKYARTLHDDPTQGLEVSITIRTGWATCCGRRSRSLMGPTPTTRWQLASVSLWLRHACKGHRLKLRRKARRNETSDGHIQPDCACEDFLSPLGLGGAVGIGQRMAPTATPEKQFSVAFEAPENVALALRVYQRPQATSVFPYPSR